MELGLQQRLTADPVFAALAGTRLYPVQLPDEGAMPAATYQRVSPGRTYTTTGPVKLSRIRVQIDFYGDTYADTVALYKAVLGSIDFFRGTLPDGTYVDTVQLDNCEDLYDSISRLYHRMTDWVFLAAE